MVRLGQTVWRKRGDVLELVGVGQSVNTSNTRREHGVEGDVTDCTANYVSAEKETPGQLIVSQLEKERTACLLELGVSISLQLEDPFLDVIQLVDIATDGIYLLTHKKTKGENRGSGGPRTNLTNDVDGVRHGTLGPTRPPRIRRPNTFQPIRFCWRFPVCFSAYCTALSLYFRVLRSLSSLCSFLIWVDM